MPPYNATDPSASFLSTSCLDFLMIELVPLAQRITKQIDAAAAAAATMDEGGGGGGGGDAGAGSETRAGAVAPPPQKIDEEEERDAVYQRLEMLGYRVGQGLAERFSRDRPRFTDSLDMIKFICKDIWSIVFGKQVDNLKTNHRGVYVLTDSCFRPISKMSTEPGGQAVLRAKPFLCFPCGIVRGTLAAMGITATVQAETTDLPIATFHIKTFPART